MDHTPSRHGNGNGWGESDGEVECGRGEGVVPHTFMACIMQGQRLGAAYYDHSTGEVFVLESWEDPGEAYPSLQLLKLQAQPQVIYTSTKSDVPFFEALRRSLTKDGPEFEVKTMKSSDFSLDQAKTRLAYLRVRGMPDNISEVERLHLINSMINLRLEVQVRAAGGLIMGLHRDLIMDTIGASSAGAVDVEKLAEISLDGMLKVDPTTLDALQIFQPERHPSAMGVGRPKEGLSLFGLLDKCSTRQGRKLLRLWFLRPIVDVDRIEDRLDTIEWLSRSRDLIDALKKGLRCIECVPRILKKFTCCGYASTVKDWSLLVQSLSSMCNLKDVLSIAFSSRHVGGNHENESLGNLSPVQKVLEVVNEDLIYVIELVNKIIDFDQEFFDGKRALVRYHLSEQLDDVKRKYNGLVDILDGATRREMTRILESVGPLIPHQTLASGAIVFTPEMGYSLRFEGARLPDSVLEILSDLRLIIEGEDQNGRGVHYQTALTLQMNKVVGDLYNVITDMEGEIIRGLEARVLGFTDVLRKAADAMAELDCVVSLSEAALEHNFKRPRLVRGSDVMKIKNGRHPLQELVVNTFIPNNTHVDENKGRVNIITGPNCSGKSVYAKQVAMITFMAHIGSFVPADECILGLCDRIFTRILSKETALLPQSTFMIDLNQIAVMLRHATSKSLCIIDEFGKGTLASDGIGLLCATIQHLMSSATPPKVFACTHYTELRNEEYLPRSEQIEFYTMCILEAKGKRPAVPADERSAEKLSAAEGMSSESDLDRQITFLYKLVPGYSTSSFGIHCAQLANVHAAILKRAEELLKHEREGQPVCRSEDMLQHLSTTRTCKEVGEAFLKLSNSADAVSVFLQEMV
ncbi:hypothetical protein CBR_g24261 [Chara braunii]|uniref:DNA mismatch repair proteins mutS family domain-containing protein n=1 Tax=Chara braunii TaxID=69332 RepID=A0A388JM63_CHABU|nr:hypothetical protein CBR_g24261 [Chara braunii]|eukprot:GBG58910.1 hypothetical protein CBR_g24261 [Chara braunii]